ncbi:hypothetical protein [Planktothrix agardhii]|uniref:hypothetical protein n=1 Tax=Planktothrix agardhii TaxID=1160 RepID=UPI0004148B97|nr:hypothetical protein [Planktothrix agardhii]
MELYVQSCGVSKEYCWLDKNQTKISDLPDNLKQMLEMVDGDYFSLVIYRAKNQLSLLVTALKSQNRIDNRTRKICNSLLWVGDNSDEDEATLRSLSIQALNEKLEAKVDPAVTSDNLEDNAQGFKVKFEQLKPENLGLPSVENNGSDSSKKIGNLSALKDSLIDDLKKYSLPKHDGMLVVVCSTVSQSSLEREQVWRGLSDGISGDEWIDLPVKGDKKNDNFRRQPSSNTTTTAQSASPNIQNNAGNNKGVQAKQGLTIGQKVLSVFLAISIIINIGLFLKWQEAIENKKEYDNLKEESKTLKKEIDKDKKTIETQGKEIDQQNFNLKRGGEILNKRIKFNERFNTEGRQLLDEDNNFIKGIQK